jgi:uncharacterized membrane protein HdeD (DUF308 family)
MFEDEELDERRSNALRLLICGTALLLGGGIWLLTHASSWAAVQMICGGMLALSGVLSLAKLRSNSGREQRQADGSTVTLSIDHETR